MRVIDFYDRHPISEQQVLAAVARRRGGALGTLTADDLFDFDQDHFVDLVEAGKLGGGRFTASR